MVPFILKVQKKQIYKERRRLVVAMGEGRGNRK